MSHADDSIIQAADFKPPPAPGASSPIRLRPLALMVALALAVLLLLVWFIFTARAVHLDISPKPDKLRLAGGLFQWQLGARHLLRPGTWLLQAEKTGYHRLESQFQVTGDAEQSFAFHLQKLPGQLRISARPGVSAEVYLDGAFAGRLPEAEPLLLASVPPGKRQLRLMAERYQILDTEIDIQGMEQLQELNAQLLPAWANVSISSEPPGAEVLLDGEALASTPGSLEILEGKRRVMLRLSGYREWSRELTLTAGETIDLGKIPLLPSDGTLFIRSKPSGANVTLNGRYLGQSPLDLGLAPGQSYALQLSKAGFMPKELSVPIEPATDVHLNLELSPVTGTIELAASPQDARLKVNGRDFGAANQRLSLPVAEHQIEVYRQGYAPHRTRITPTPGYEQQLSIELLTLEADRVRRIPRELTTSAGHTLKYIAPLDFSMGADRRAPGRRSNEIEKQVQLKRGYYLSVTEVTNAQLRAFRPEHDSGQEGRALLNRDDRPAVKVSFRVAALYCNWLSRRDGLAAAYEVSGEQIQLVRPLTTGYRLPTEAEWVRAARYADPSGDIFPWGRSLPPPAGSGNYADASAEGISSTRINGYNDGFPGTSPPGSFAANSLGLFDLSGNVAEWVNDRYSALPVVSSRPVTDPLGPETGEYRVIRGSSFMHGRFSELRWAFRDYGKAERSDVGFRIARYLEESK